VLKAPDYLAELSQLGCMVTVNNSRVLIAPDTRFGSIELELVV